MLYLSNADTAIWLLRKDKELAKEGKVNELGKKKEQNGLTCLHLLAKMSYVFRSYPESSRMGKLKKFLYYLYVSAAIYHVLSQQKYFCLTQLTLSPKHS